MAKIRAYKLAEELELERHELVERAAEMGIELKSAMASLDEEQVALLREKLGRSRGRGPDMEESRVKSKGGTTVLRRRKKAKEPEPELVQPEPVTESEPSESEAPSGPTSDEPTPEAEPTADESELVLPGPVVDTLPVQPGAERDRAAAAPDKPEPAQPAADRKGKQRKRVREVVNLQEQERFARQITGRGGPTRRTTMVAPRQVASPRKKRRDKLSVPAVAGALSEQKRVIKVEGEISVGELAKLLGAKSPAIQGKLMALGIMVSINQTVDVETSEQIATEFGFEVQDVGFKEAEFLDVAPAAAEGQEAEGSPNLMARPPVITVMGHVDHGKTSLLDAIRKSAVNVTDSEAGGITQHIGAYRAEVGGRSLTFIDTPGHAAFTAMRARGAAVTDIVVLVVAANDGVMPQTVEAIEHAQAAGCPIVVAINKCDLGDADPSRTKQRLTEHNLVAEDFGGDVICVEVSAKTGEGLDQLLEMLLLQSDVLELKADPTRRASGVVLESRLAKGRGPMATVLIQEGTLRRGDVVVVQTESGRVRVMEDEDGQKLKEAGPSTPVQILGLSGVPSAGAAIHVVESDRVARQISSHREDQARSATVKPSAKVTLDEFFAKAEGLGAKELNVVLKTDVQGTCEAVRDALVNLSTDEVKLTVLSSGVGAINENDVMLASASGAVVVGFHIRPDPAARKAADSVGVEIRTYTIIMELLDEIEASMAGLLPAVVKEHMLGRAEIRQLFTIPKIGTIAGSLVIEGKVLRSGHCRLVRDGVQVYQGRLASLRRFKDDVKEVTNAMECGISIEGYNDLKTGDVIEVFEVEELPATL